MSTTITVAPSAWKLPYQVAHDRTGVASPMKLIEYMAMAKAVVAARQDNTCDVGSDNGTGLLFAPDDAMSLTRAFRRLEDTRSPGAGDDPVDQELAPERGSCSRAPANVRRSHLG
jgi:hypothetical protein